MEFTLSQWQQSGWLSPAEFAAWMKAVRLFVKLRPAQKVNSMIF
jgi:hypothetical protein